MDKRKIFKSALSLILVGLITKIFASIAKIIMARSLNVNAMGIYMLVIPLYIFLVNVIQLSLPTTIATKIANNPKQTNKIIITSSLISLVVNVLFMILIISLAPFIAIYVLKNESTKLSIMSLALLIPLISLGGLIKGYYMGIGNVEITGYSQISEEIARIIFILIFVYIFKDKGDAYLAYGAFLSLSAGEIFSLTHMILRLPNLKNKPKLFFKGMQDKENYITKDILNVALPLTSGKLISTIAYSLEPIIMTSLMLKLGYSSTYITSEYGIISGYAFPLLLLPGFFANAFSRVLLQPLTTCISNKEYSKGKKLIISICLSSLFIGLIFSIIMFLFPEFLMNILYGSEIGSNYVKLFAFPIILYYIEAPLISAMMAISKTRNIMIFDTFVSIIRILSIIVLIPKVGILAVPISTRLNSSLLVILVIINIYLFFKSQDKMII